MSLAQSPQFSANFEQKQAKNRLTRLPGGLFFRNALNEIYSELYYGWLDTEIISGCDNLTLEELLNIFSKTAE